MTEKPTFVRLLLACPLFWVHYITIHPCDYETPTFMSLLLSIALSDVIHPCDYETPIKWDCFQLVHCFECIVHTSMRLCPLLQCCYIIHPCDHETPVKWDCFQIVRCFEYSYRPIFKAPSRENGDAGDNERAGLTTSRTGRR